ncbi:hypothetical protein H5410_023562 [Solanum commersonii]|uniref:Uncharacterized protein n=1 Tax=Solanum commersonii TaxID=4109 RepID=A0A9J5ZH75_SOLCO|nr:hypothetical protein H5410_023562 [Solanum commersonii]
MAMESFCICKADRGGGESSPEEDTKIWSKRKASTFIGFKYCAAFLASFLGGAKQVGVAELAVLTSPLVHLKQQLDCIAIASSIPLIGCYSLLSTPRDWTEATVFFFMTLVMNLATLPLICALNVWVFVFLAIVVICVGFMIYKFLPEIGKKEGELPEAEIWKMHWFWKKVLPK